MEDEDVGTLPFLISQGHFAALGVGGAIKDPPTPSLHSVLRRVNFASELAKLKKGVLGELFSKGHW